MVCYVIVKYLLIFGTAAVGVFSRPEVFTINTAGCRILAYPLVTDKMLPMLARPNVADTTCSNRSVPLVKANSTHIWVVQGLEKYSMINGSSSEFYCCYRNFSARGYVENIGYGACQEFTKVIKGNHEFVRVQCYNKEDKIYEDFFRFNVYKKKQYNRKFNKKNFNVIMFGIDGISRKNFLRTMPKTANFLKSRASVQLYGYNKVGDNSYPNLFPMLSGKSFHEAKDVCFRNNYNYNAKACPFLWNLYKSAGYKTALGSDSSSGVLGLYENLLPYQPTDYYTQAFMYEIRHTYSDKVYDYHICLRDRYVFRELLNFAKDVITTVRFDKLFGLFWEESISHHAVNYPYILDNDYFRLLSDMEKNWILEDSIIIFFSDHGMRFGDILYTQEGRQEARLPLFEILFPPRFRRRFRTAYKNIQMNSHRLTTPYDIHQTLLDLINMSTIEDRELKTKTAVNGHSSLFLPISTNRTCKSLGIPEHWCTCLGGEIITVGQKGQTFTAKYLLKHVNQILGEYPLCHKLDIERIFEVQAMKDNVLNDRTYRVLIQTKPGGAVLEGTLVRERKKWLVSDISRLNSYHNQSICVKDPVIKSYCYCRKPRPAG